MYYNIITIVIIMIINEFLVQIWDDISPQLLSTFWSLTMYDLYVPERIYQKKIKDLKEQKS